jgi:hypothetical protein
VCESFTHWLVELAYLSGCSTENTSEPLPVKTEAIRRISVRRSATNPNARSAKIERAVGFHIGGHPLHFWVCARPTVYGGGHLQRGAGISHAYHPVSRPRAEV